MDEIQLQEKHIYDKLSPIFEEQGYELHLHKKQFILPTRNGFRTALVSLSGDQQEQTINFKLGVRLDVVEELANQFVVDLSAECKETTTILTPYNRLIKHPQKKFIISTESDMEEMCKRIASFMRQEGFRFLENYDRLRKLDALLNRKPQLHSPFLPNQVNRCFKGTVIAKLTHRNDFNRLVKSYMVNLKKQWMHQETLTNYKKLVRFLRFYSIN